MRKLLYFAACALVLGCGPEDSNEQESAPEGIETILPFELIDLSTLDDFNDQEGNWQLAAAVTSDPTVKHDLLVTDGNGILANLPSKDKNSNLTTAWDHGDLEIKFDVLMPQGSNSGVYFQGRYEVQLLDSWGKAEVGSGDMGGVYERWDDSKPSGLQGYDGHPPQVNAARAPGLWQTFHVLFKAPRFDPEGNKIRNAHFDFVKLNGHQIHKDVDLSGPTRGAMFDSEASAGPLLIQGDHGPVAFRNMQYKAFATDTLTVKNLTYAYYEGNWDYLPDFDTLSPTANGNVDFFDLPTISQRADHYAVVFRGELTVATAGNYLFETYIDDGGNLSIDSQLVIHNVGEPGGGSAFGKVFLEKGTHALELSYYQEVWAAFALLYYEGPGIERRMLASHQEISDWQRRQAAMPRLVLDDISEPTLLRGFVNHREDKLTHTISVGDPVGIHYAYDLLDGTIVKGWKGQFADVTNMWRNRGQSQLAIPLNAALDFGRGIRLAKLNHEDSAWPIYRPSDFRYGGYEMVDGLPTFHYHVHGVDVSDRIVPDAASGKLHRALAFAKAGQAGLYYKLDEATQIQRLDNGAYNIGGRYYLESDQDLIIRELENQDELLVSLQDKENLSYSILW